MRTVRIKIIKAKTKNSWYRNLIGAELYALYDYSFGKAYRFKVNYGHKLIRHSDCIEINEKFCNWLLKDDCLYKPSCNLDLQYIKLKSNEFNYCPNCGLRIKYD